MNVHMSMCVYVYVCVLTHNITAKNSKPKPSTNLSLKHMENVEIPMGLIFSFYLVSCVAFFSIRGKH